MLNTETESNGWSVHLDYRAAEDITEVFLLVGRRPSRGFATVSETGDIQLTQFDPVDPLKYPAKPFLRVRGELAGIVAALAEAVRKQGYLPDVERELRAELAGVKGSETYAKAIVDRLLTHLLRGLPATP